MNAERIDSVDDYVACLTEALQGPARAKSLLVGEIRDGLVDTVAAHTDQGMPDRQALQRALREFGTPGDLAPSCQQELTIAQTRRTAQALLFAVGFLVLSWYVIWTAAQLRGWQLPEAVQPLTGVAVLTGLLAVAALASTGPLTRWLPVPDRLPLVMSWAGTAASLIMPLAGFALAVTASVAAAWPLIALAAACTLAAHVFLAASARTCRECARHTVQA